MVLVSSLAMKPLSLLTPFPSLVFVLFRPLDGLGLSGAKSSSSDPVGLGSLPALDSSAKRASRVDGERLPNLGAPGGETENSCCATGVGDRAPSTSVNASSS